MPTIGFTTTTFTDEPTALPGLEFAVENGFHALELSGNHLWPEVAKAPELERLREDGRRYRIALSIHFPPSFRLGSAERSAGSGSIVTDIDTVSIVVPTYNRLSRLRRCVERVRANVGG